MISSITRFSSILLKKTCFHDQIKSTMTCSNDFKEKRLTNRTWCRRAKKKKSSLNPNFDAINIQNHQNHENHQKSTKKRQTTSQTDMQTGRQTASASSLGGRWRNMSAHNCYHVRCNNAMLYKGHGSRTPAGPPKKWHAGVCPLARPMLPALHQ